MTIFAAADGSALGNPGPAGWGWYIDESRWASGGWPHGTNNMGELKAVLDLLEQTAGSGQDLHIYCDSLYVINSVTKWMPGWKRNGWRKKDKSPVLNVELMQALDARMRAAEREGRTIRFEWVKGHAGHELNEKADALANAAALAHQAGRDPVAGPGFSPAAPGAGAPGTPDRSGPARAAVSAAPDDLADLADLERALATRAGRRGGVAERLLHPDWVRVTAAGRQLSRSDLLGSSPGSDPAVTITEVIALGADAALVLSTHTLGTRTARCVAAWVRTGSGWQQRHQQFSPVS